MPSLKEKINSDVKEAMKAGDENVVGVLRMLLASIQNMEIDNHAKGKEDLSDEDVVTALRKETKKRTEAIQVYRDAERGDLAEREEREREILQKYLPQELSDDEIENLVKEALGKGFKDFGSVMKEVMAASRGRADGKRVSEVVKRHV